MDATTLGVELMMSPSFQTVLSSASGGRVRVQDRPLPEVIEVIDPPDVIDKGIHTAVSLPRDSSGNRFYCLS